MAIGVEFVGFNYMDAGVVEDIMKNIRCLFATPEGTIPGDRSFGLSLGYVDKPLPAAQNLLALDVYEKVANCEPRVAVKDIEYSADTNGKLQATVYLEPNDEYEPDEDEEDEDDEE